MRALPVKMPCCSHNKCNIAKLGGVGLLKIKEYFKPETIEEAYSIMKKHNAVVLGGGAFLNLRKDEMPAVVDLSGLGLDYIKERDGFIEIGAMASLREVETDHQLSGFYGGVLQSTARAIMGVQIRNMATIGGTVWGRYGFSDMLTSLLALDAYVELYKGGMIPLEQFIEEGIKDDILIAVHIKKVNGKAGNLYFKSTGTSFSALNTAVSLIGGTNDGGAVKGGRFRIAVGSRPKAAKLAKSAMEFLNGTSVDEIAASRAGDIAADELDFGGDLRGSSDYRRELCRVFVKRCIMEVLK